MAKVEYVPTSAEKGSILSDLRYEIQQLLAASSIQTNDQWINNALLESHLLHVRNLLDFFEKSNRSTRRKGSKVLEMDDVLVSDFDFPIRRIGIAHHLRDRLNKDLAHLTYSRTKRRGEEKSWALAQTATPVVICAKEFAEYLVSEYLQAGGEESGFWNNLIVEIDHWLSRYAQSPETS